MKEVFLIQINFLFAKVGSQTATKIINHFDSMFPCVSKIRVLDYEVIFSLLLIIIIFSKVLSRKCIMSNRLLYLAI